MDNNKTQKRRLGVLDYFLIVVLILCIAGVGLRFIFKLGQKEDTFTGVHSQKFIVDYIARDQRTTVTDYLKKGTDFRFFASNDPFGVSEEVNHIRPAEKRYETIDGEPIPTFNTADRYEAGKYSSLYRVDIYGSFEVTGKMNEDGVLLVDGTTDQFISKNEGYTLRSDHMVFNCTVVGITPVE